MNKLINIRLHGIPRLVFAAAILWVATDLAVANWPGWRGPSANGSTTTGNYPTSWNSNGVAWKVALPGKGGSSPIVWQNRIYLTTPVDGQDAVLALDFSSKQL